MNECCIADSSSYQRMVLYVITGDAGQCSKRKDTNKCTALAHREGNDLAV